MDADMATAYELLMVGKYALVEGGPQCAKHLVDGRLLPTGQCGIAAGPDQFSGLGYRVHSEHIGACVS